MASIQDWDWVSWYVLDDVFQDPNLEKPYSRRLGYENDAHRWKGIHFVYDEVLTTGMKSAGEIFKTFALKPAPNPTVIRFGKQAMYDMDMHYYRGRYESSLWNRYEKSWPVADLLGPTTYRYGLRLQFDPDWEGGTEVIGPYVLSRGFQKCLIKPTDQIKLV